MPLYVNLIIEVILIIIGICLFFYIITLFLLLYTKVKLFTYIVVMMYNTRCMSKIIEKNN